MFDFKFCVLAVALTQLPAALGLCAAQPDWFHAYCHSNEAGSNHIFFEGNITNKDVPANPRMEETVYTMKVLEVYGGSIVANQDVKIHSDPTTAVGDRMQQGTKYLIEAHLEAKDGEYSINICEDYNSIWDGYDDWMLEFLRDKPFMDQMC